MSATRRKTMAGERQLTRAEDTLASILTEAIVEELLEGAPDGHWLVVACADEVQQLKLAEQLRTQGYEVSLRKRAA